MSVEFFGPEFGPESCSWKGEVARAVAGRLMRR